MSEEKLVPKLRFSGFDDEWVQVNIKDISKSITKGTTPKNYSDHGINFIKVESIVNNKITKIDAFIDEDTHYNELNRSILKKNDLLFSIAGSLGRTTIITDDILPANTNQALSIIRFEKNKDLNLKFIESRLNRYDIAKYIFQNLAVGAQPNLNLQQVGKICINLPSYSEQNKIQSFLDYIDNKIELLEAKHKSYIGFKKYLMQQIFTQKLRFDKNCYYKNKKVKDNLIESKIEGSDNINRRLTVKLNLKGISVRESKTTEFEGATKQFIRKSGQFIYGKQNLHKGAFGIIPKELDGYLSSSDIPSFDFIGEINPKWFYYYFSRQSFYENLERLSTGTGSKRISPKDFLNIRIMIPDINEQNKIVSILNNIDKKINIISNQIVETNEFKKGLLQQMFV